MERTLRFKGTKARILCRARNTQGEIHMSIRAFWSICGLVAVAALILFLTGNFTTNVAIVFGFIAFGLTFMGMMNVLPIAIAHPPVPKPENAMPAVEAQPARPTLAPTALKTWKSA
jgi:hypothetical protein